MTTENGQSSAPSASRCSSALPIYSEETIGRLLRRLNLMCVKAAEADQVEAARKAAAFSRAVEDAMKFAGIE